ncbi:hypothetical protein Tco_0265602 [Tanacetum coccineum]
MIFRLECDNFDLESLLVKLTSLNYCLDMYLLSNHYHFLVIEEDIDFIDYEEALNANFLDFFRYDIEDSHLSPECIFVLEWVLAVDSSRYRRFTLAFSILYPSFWIRREVRASSTDDFSSRLLNQGYLRVCQHQHSSYVDSEVSHPYPDGGHPSVESCSTPSGITLRCCDFGGVTHTPTFIQPSTSQPQKKQRPRKPKRKDTQIPQSSGPIDNVADEAVNEEMDDSLERAATTATSLDGEQDRGGGPRRQETIGDTIAQTKFENVSKTSNDLLFARANEITSLKRRVKKLKRRNKSRTHGLKRMYRVGSSRRVESSKDEGLGEEDASKHGRIADIDDNKDIYLVNVYTDEDMFSVNDLDGDEVIVDNVDVVKTIEETRSVVEEVTAVIEKAKLVSAAEETVNAAATIVSTASTIPVSAATTTTTTTATITNVEITLAQALAELKSAKPKAVKPVVEQVKPIKRLEQIRLDEELAFKLQAEEEEEERLSRDKALQT